MKFIFSIILCLFLINCQTENKNFIPSYDFDKGNSSGSSYSSKNYQESSQASNSTSNNSSSNSGYSY